MNRLPNTFTTQGQIDKMKQFIRNFTTSSASKVASTTHLMRWIESGFDLAKISKEALGELVKLAAVAEDKNRIAVCDLLRLLVL